MSRARDMASVGAQAASLAGGISLELDLQAKAATSYNYTNEDLTSIVYDTGNVVNYTYTNGDLTSVDYTDTDGTTNVLTVTYNYTDGVLTSTTRTLA